MKITITNAYTWYNKGDAGILLGTVNTLKKIYGVQNIIIDVFSFTPEEDKKRYCNDPVINNVYSNILNPHPYKHTKIGKMVAILKLLCQFLYYYVLLKIEFDKLIKKNKQFHILKNSDIIIVCGGGFLGGKKYDSLMHLFQIYVNTLFDVPVYIIGTSIEPIKNVLIKKITNNVLKKVNYIFAREIITYEYLKTFLKKEKFTLIPDMAFMLEDKHKYFPVLDCFKKDNKIIYGITVRNWNFPNHDNSKILMNNYVNALKDMMDYEIENRNCAFVFVPQVIVKHGNDVDVAKVIKSKLKIQNQNNFLILEDDFSPVTIKALIENFDFFIGTRMHSNIFAISMKIPTIAIAYEKKTNGIMNTVGLNDYIIEMDKISFQELKCKMQKQRENSLSIRKNLEKKVYELQEEIITDIGRVINK